MLVSWSVSNLLALITIWVTGVDLDWTKSEVIIINYLSASVRSVDIRFYKVLSFWDHYEFQGFLKYVYEEMDLQIPDLNLNYSLSQILYFILSTDWLSLLNMKKRYIWITHMFTHAVGVHVCVNMGIFCFRANNEEASSSRQLAKGWKIE